jgi:two-component system sensor histidine kinase HydH
MGDSLRYPTVSRGALVRLTILAGALAVVSYLRYVTGPSPTILHELSLRLYYLPILVGAYWYGPGGGLFVAFIASLVYVRHLQSGGPLFDVSRYAEVVVFYLIGVSVGILASAQRRVMVRFQNAAARLESANQELRESYQQIRRIDRLKTLGEVAAGLAHEIRHPLASINGALEIIEARALASSPEAEFSRLAMREVQRLDKLVWEFLKFARPHAPELRSIPLHDVVAPVSTLLSAEAARAGITLRVEPCEIPIQVSIDPLQIEQVLLNVVLNAIQATPSGGRIVIREHMAHGAAFVDIADEGPGIASEDLQRIFSPFFTTREKGTGLGLAIAHHIVAAHEGSLDVHQTSSTGTCFRVRLPLDGRIDGIRSPSESEVAV